MPAPGNEAHAVAPPRRRAATSWREPAVAAVVLIAVLGAALAAVVGVRVGDNAAKLRATSDEAQAWSPAQRASIAGAATSAVATVLSYDYRHLDQDFAAAHRVITPSFRRQYDATTGKGVRPLATRYHAISDAQVSAAGLVQASADRAIVLVFVNQSVTNTQLTAPRLDRSRIDVTLVRSGGHWLIDKMQTL